MRALTIQQPWASLLMAGEKGYETRSWRPPAALEGERIALHAGKSKQGVSLYTQDMMPLDHRHRAALAIGYQDPDRPLVFGALLGTAVLAFYIQTDSELGTEIADTERALGDWSPGRFAWRFTDHEPFAQPIPMPGRLGLFSIPDEVITTARNPNP